MTFGYWPQVKPAFWSIALFRWDINVRESAVLGLVGAGGIGMALDSALNLFQWDRVALILLAIFAVVIVAEIVVTQVRKRVIYEAIRDVSIIAVFNQKGGVGKTTTALNLLAAIAPRKAAAARHRPRSAVPPVARLRRAPEARRRLDLQLLRAPAAARRHRADHEERRRSCCPAHLELAKLDSLLGKGVNVVTRLRQALHAPDAAPGPVVIDCCPLLNVLSLNAVFAADLLLVPVSADFLSLQGRGAGRARAQRARAGVQAAAAAALPADALRRAAADERTRSRSGCAKSLRAGRDLRDADPREREAGGKPGGRARHLPPCAGQPRRAATTTALYDELLGAGFLRVTARRR